MAILHLSTVIVHQIELENKSTHFFHFLQIQLAHDVSDPQLPHLPTKLQQVLVKLHHRLVTHHVPKESELDPNRLEQLLEKKQHRLAPPQHPILGRNVQLSQQLHSQHRHEHRGRSKEVVCSLVVGHFKSLSSLYGVDPAVQIYEPQEPSPSKISSRIFSLESEFYPFSGLSGLNCSAWPQSFPNPHEHSFMMFIGTIIDGFPDFFNFTNGIFPAVKHLEHNPYSKLTIIAPNIFDGA